MHLHTTLDNNHWAGVTSNTSAIALAKSCVFGKQFFLSILCS